MPQFALIFRDIAISTLIAHARFFPASLHGPRVSVVRVETLLVRERDTSEGGIEKETVVSSTFLDVEEESSPF